MNNEEKKYNKLTPFKMQVLQSFPFIDEDFDAITNYELLCKVVEYLNKTVENVDLLNEKLIEFQNYFDNLDVQEEINNKLDKMAESGELTDLIKNYIDPIYQEYENSINNQINSMNNSIRNIDNKVNNSIGNNPIPVNSIDEMTDETKIYLLTTNGYWYYYDNGWTQGGVYQSTGFANNNIIPEYTSFYENYNLIPKTNWIEGKIIGNNGVISDYSAGCYNEEYIEVVPSDTLYLIYNENINFNYMKIREYNENKEFIVSNDLLNISKYVLKSNTKYVRFTSWNNKFTILPDNCYILVSSNIFKTINSYNIYNRIDKNYKDNILSDEILLENFNKYLSRPYAYGLTLQTVNFNNIRDVIYTANINQSVVYTGMYVILPNIKLHDIIYVDVSNTNYIPASVRFLRPGDSLVKEFRKVDDYHYVVEVDNNIILYKNDMRIVLQYTSLPTNETLNVNLKFSINSTYNTGYEFLQKDKPLKKFILLGDSITHITGQANWFLHLQQKINASLIANVSVDGARLKDYPDTGDYDGNPTSGSNNVLGNQVQKIINNDYDEPDIIMIAIGTNGGINTTSQQIKSTYYDNQEVLIPVDNVNRQTDAGAFRWCNEKLHNKYPKAKIIWCTPIQGTARSTHAVIEWGNNLKELCSWGSNYCCDTEKCGISITNASEYLYDGLHPNIFGGQLIGEYNASQIEKFCK